MGECGEEHADRSMPMGWCDKKGEKGSNYLFYCLFTDYIFLWEWNHADGSMGMEACGTECVDRSMQMRACKWERGDGNVVMGAIFF